MTVQQSLPLNDKEAQTKRILRLLKTKHTVTNYELNKIAFRYSARIRNLREQGYIIVSNHVGGSLWTFTFKGHEDDEQEYGDVGD
jgi:hypothetical protein